MVDERLPRENPDQDVRTERRRPGRLEYSNPALIRMMRGTYDAALHELHRIEDEDAGRPAPKDSSEPPASDRDDLRPARGVAFSVGVGAALWLVLGGAIWVLVRIL